MYQFGGRQVAHVFFGNMGGPSLKTLKHGKAKLMPFWPGFKVGTFKEVNQILDAAKKHKGIIVDVLVILVEDETQIKPRPRLVFGI